MVCYNHTMDNIVIKIEDKTVTLPRYSTVYKALEKAGLSVAARYEDNPIVGATVNGELQPLGAVIETLEATVSPIRVFDYYGRRIYRHSLAFLLGMAAQQIFPDRVLTIWHSMGNSLYFSFEDNQVLEQTDIEALSSRMSSIVRNNYEIEYTALTCSAAVEYFKKNNRTDTAELISNHNNPSIFLYKVEDHYDMAYEPLAPRTGLLTVWDLVPYGRRGMLLRYPDSPDVQNLRNTTDNPKLFSVFEEYKQWGKILGVSSASQMNKRVTDGSVNQYIRLSESLQRKKLYALADEITRRQSKSVFISGPSSSGKTTFSKKLCEQLSLMGYDPIQISLDDYYKPRVEIPLNKKGEPDYECIEALRVDAFKSDMEKLFKREEVYLPIWSIAHQKLTYRDKTVKLDDYSIFVIEGIHALNPVFTSCVPKESVFRIYISALTQLTLDSHNRISTTDTRILRRLIRDNRTRGISATDTLSMWGSIATGERKHIFPFQSNADVMFNTSLDYEIGVLSTYAIPLLAEVSPESGGAYTDARRLLSFLKNINAIPSDPVPSDSLLREFIGGSDYEE